MAEHAPSVVFLCSPNNPTGTALELDVVDAVYRAGETHRTVVVVDEAYAEFAREGTPSALTLLEDRPRLIVSRTMSKAFALAGARLGYFAAAPEIADAMRLVRLPYHLSSVTQATALAALEHHGALLATVEDIKTQRDRIVRELTRLGLAPSASDSNFVFFDCGGDAHAMWQALLDDGVLVRDVGIPGHLRVTMRHGARDVRVPGRCGGVPVRALSHDGPTFTGGRRPGAGCGRRVGQGAEQLRSRLDWNDPRAPRVPPLPDRPRAGGSNHEESVPDMSATEKQRTATVERVTSESTVRVSLDLDGTGTSRIDTSVPFYDHMLTALSRHSLIDLDVTAHGDTHIDVHHTVEDTAIVLGEALREALGDKRGIRRFGQATVPLDEALASAVVDVSGRPYVVHTGEPEGQQYHLIGGHFTGSMTRHVLESLAHHAQLCLHMDVVRGRDPHHIVEAQFKALARALREAVELDPRMVSTIPSTKGAL